MSYIEEEEGWYRITMTEKLAQYLRNNPGYRSILIVRF